MGKEFTHGLAVDVGGVRVGEGVDGEGVGEGAELASVARSVATLPEVFDGFEVGFHRAEEESSLASFGGCCEVDLEDDQESDDLGVAFCAAVSNPQGSSSPWQPSRRLVPRSACAKGQ